VEENPTKPSKPGKFDQAGNGDAVYCGCARLLE